MHSDEHWSGVDVGDSAVPVLSAAITLSSKERRWDIERTSVRSAHGRFITAEDRSGPSLELDEYA